MSPDDEARFGKKTRPSKAAQREAHVEHDEGEENEGRVRLEDQLWDLREPVAVQVQEERDDAQRDDDREDGARLAQPLTQRYVVGFGGVIALVHRLGERVGSVRVSVVRTGVRRIQGT